MKVIMRNHQLEVSVDTLGAEIVSIRDRETQTEYIWQADPKYWKRHAPVLFPFVGSLKEKQYSYQNRTYAMGQHGFARDLEFSLMEEKEEELWFELASDETTLQSYPFEFRLQIGYQLEERSVRVMYRVINPMEDTMYFSIGAHPAFYCPYHKAEKGYYLRLNTSQKIKAYYLDETLGLRQPEAKDVKVHYVDETYSYLKVRNELFANDALIIEDSDINEVCLCSHDKTPFVTVTFDAPLFGLWSPAKKSAPFVCIEPWYGRCDGMDSSKEIDEKEYVNKLKGREIFERNYTMTF